MRSDAAVKHDSLTKPGADPLAARYLDAPCRVTLTGVQALARLPLDQARSDLAQGRRVAAFISGYEGSPLAGYDLELGRQRSLLDEHGIRFEPGLNEEAAAMAVQGSQLIRELQPTVDGVVGYWYGKAPGLDRASDAFRHANLMGTDPAGGAVAFVGDDPAAKSSSVPCSSEIALADLMMPTFYPSDPAEVLELGRHAVACSRASGLWSALKIVTAVADGACTVDLNAGERFAPMLPLGSGAHVPTSKLLPPHLAPLERDMTTTRVRLAREYAVLNGLNRVVRRGRADRVGIITAGTEYLDTMQALATLGLGEDAASGAPSERPGGGASGIANGEPRAPGQHNATIRIMKLGLIWPLDATQLREFARGLDTIIVIEEKRAFIELQLRELLYDSEHRPVILGKRDAQGKELFPAYGELTADIVTRVLAGALEDCEGMPGVAAWLEARRSSPLSPERKLLPLATRTPYFCSGCPHNSSTKPRTDSAFGAGIGCHAMVLLMDPKQVGDVVGLTQMGGEGTQWIGMAPFVANRHFVQNLGDGTFHHSGSLAIRASVAAGQNITYRLLYNSTVAMTGGQDAVGQMNVPSISRALLAEGVAKIIVTSDEPRALRRAGMPRRVEVWPRERLGEAQEALAAVPGTTVLIHAQECATQLRRKRKRGLAPKPEEFVMINERICEGCGDCGEKSNCLSVQPVETEFGRKTRIHQSSCNVDKSCLNGNCPAFVTVRPGKIAARRGAPELASDELPLPPATDSAGTAGTAGTAGAAPVQRIRLMGVGGTGIVTTSQLLATAAVLAGRYTRTLDKTGLAQKGGAVISDVTIAPAPFEAGSAISTHACDLYLGYDLLVAAEPGNIAAIAADATAIVSTSIVPTGAMVSDRRVEFPEIAGTLAPIAERVPSGRFIELDLRRYAEGLFGAEQFGNMFLLGVAVQRGALRLPPEAIEQAIALNGVAVSANTQSFRRGRQFVADRAALDACLGICLDGGGSSGGGRSGSGSVTGTGSGSGSGSGSVIVAAAAGSELERLVAIRRVELASYQHERYARRYEAFVESVRAKEDEVTGGASTRLAEAVARHLFQLMAYKDEYEVPRLALDPAMGEAVAAQFGEGAAVTWKLHPPALKALGLRRKIGLGPWFRPGFTLLRAGRRLRGTPFDPFGRDEVRRVERGLIAEYEGTLAALLPRLVAVAGEDAAAHGAVDIELAVELAQLPGVIRGYDEVKMRGVALYRQRREELLAQCGIGVVSHG